MAYPVDWSPYILVCVAELWGTEVLAGAVPTKALPAGTEVNVAVQASPS